MSSKMVGRKTGKDENETLQEKYMSAVKYGFGSFSVSKVSRRLIPKQRRKRTSAHGACYHARETLTSNASTATSLPDTAGQSHPFLILVQEASSVRRIG